MRGSALDSSDLLLLYSIVSLVSHITPILISNLFKHKTYLPTYLRAKRGWTARYAGGTRHARPGRSSRRWPRAGKLGVIEAIYSILPLSYFMSYGALDRSDVLRS